MPVHSGGRGKKLWRNMGKGRMCMKGEQKLDRKTFIALSALEMRKDRNEREAVATAEKLADELESRGQAPWMDPGPADDKPDECAIREGGFRQLPEGL